MSERKGNVYLFEQNLWGDSMEYWGKSFKISDTISLMGAKSKPNLKDNDIVVKKVQDLQYVVLVLNDIKYENNPKDMYTCKALVKAIISIGKPGEMNIQELFEFLSNDEDFKTLVKEE